MSLNTYKVTAADGAWALIEARDIPGALKIRAAMYRDESETIEVKLVEGRRHVRKHVYHDPDTGKKQTSWDVIVDPPDSVNAATWGDDYLIARYTDKLAAEEHARMNRKPYGYG